MFAYYFNLALRSFRRNKVLTALMVLAIALGIGTCMTTLSVFYVLSGDPLPGRSQVLFYPQLDPQPVRGYQPGEEPPDQLTRYDAEALLRDARGDRQALMTGGGVAIEPQTAGIPAFQVDARYTSADFFPMFDVPFQYGRGWDASADGDHARVAVISKELNDKLFGGADSVGKILNIDQTGFRIVGVLAHWRPAPRFYDLSQDNYGQLEQVFVPFTTSRDLSMARSGNMDCFATRPPGVKDTDSGAGCVWMQYWVQLDTPAKVAEYRRYLDNYANQQHAAGRFERPANVRLHGLMDWLDYKQVVPGDVRLQAILAFGFLVVCLINTIGLLLAKFLRRGGEIGVRRALGASRRAIFYQCLVEAGTVGMVGGLFGLLLALVGLWLVRQQPVAYAQLAHLDLAMLFTAIALSLLASLLAGLLPAWRAMQIAPAMQLKSQ